MSATRPFRLVLALASVTILVAPAQGQTTWFVDDDNCPGPGNGSQEDPFCDLQDALNASTATDQIWVAEGTYKPTVPGGARTATFQLQNDEPIYGGFPDGFGDGTFEARDPDTFITILSGDLDGDDIDVPCADDSPDCDSFGDLCVDNVCIISDNNDENSYHVLTGSGTNETAVLDGFTITAGNADDVSVPNNEGGGMLNVGGSPTVTDCMFIGNLAIRGGGVYCESSNPTISDSRITANSAELGGGVFYKSSEPTLSNCQINRNSATLGGGSYSESTVVTMVDCEFTGNVADDAGAGMYHTLGGALRLTSCSILENIVTDANARGGGISQNGGDMTMTDGLVMGNRSFHGAGVYLGSSSATLTDCTFIGNVAGDNNFASGGGLFYESNLSLLLSNCSFFDNEAHQGGGLAIQGSNAVVNGGTIEGNTAVIGGGISVGLPVTESVELRNLIIRNNTAQLGGGVYTTQNAAPTIANCLIVQNAATQFGGAVYTRVQSLPTLVNCTLGANEATIGGGVYNGDSSAILTDCIVWDNSGGAILGAIALVNYSSVQGGYVGNGNIDADPLFAPGPLGCYYLSQIAAGQAEDSPCVDAGDPDSPLPDGTTRTDEVADTGIVDMGYHYPITGLIPGAPGVSFDDCAFDGFVDARSESTDGATIIGLERITLCFSTPMENNDGTPLNASAFSITDTAGTPPLITDIAVHAPAVTINLSRPITLQEWTTISVSARTQCDQEILEESIDVGYLPADVDQNGCVSPFDLLTFRQYVNEIDAPEFGALVDYIDTNRDGEITPFDLLAYRQLIIGVLPHTTQPWAGECLPARP